MASGRRTVGVVGAGISGLVSIKSCLEEGLQPTCFEMHDNIGGVWYETEEIRPHQGPRAYDSLITNSSKNMTCFSDFPMPAEFPPYLTASLLQRYLLDYCAHFNLLPHVRFNTRVLNVQRAADFEETGRWQVETEGPDGKQVHVFDAVLICTGFYRTPYVPDLPGLDTFRGLKHHSRDFKTGRVYSDQNVLVVGNANSAGDTAADTANYAKQVYLSVGEGSWMLTRLAAGGMPRDYLHRRALLNMPEAVVNKVIMKEANARLDHEASGLRPDKPPLTSHVMVNDELPMKIATGKVKVVGRVTGMGERSAMLDDGSKLEDLDSVIFATGFKRDLSFLDQAVQGDKEKLEFFKMAFPVHLKHPSLALIGCLSTVGAHPPVFELQARLAARVFAGRHQLPPKSVMLEDVERLNNFVRRTTGYYKYKFPTLPMRETIAEELGVKPSFWGMLLRDPLMAFKCYFGPAFPVQYRLSGPGAWSGARQACLEAYSSGIQAPRLRQPPALASSSSSLPKFLKMTLVALVFFSIVFLTVMH